MSNITHTIWEYDGHGWSIVEATEGTQDEAKERADQLRTSYPNSSFGVRTAWPVEGERLKHAFYYGRLPEEK